jgi:oxygen-dependent protoporphyrinogen oxidase
LIAVGYTQKVVVIGAGISGLACAFRLQQLGLPCLVLEADRRAGGVIATTRRNGYQFELGPQSPRFPASVWRLVQDLRLDQEFLAGDPKAKRYIFRHGRLHPAPFSPAGLLATRLVGWSSKLRILTEPFRSTRPPPREESLAEFVERKFGTAVLDNLVDPIISTIFFGDAYKMGMQSAFPELVEWEQRYGSLARGAIRAQVSDRDARQSDATATPKRLTASARSMRVTDSLPSLGSFQSGMARLPERLAQELQEGIRYTSQVESVAPLNCEARESPPGWQIGLSNAETITTQQLVLAVPAYRAASILDRSAPSLAAQLKSIEHAPMCGVSSGYHRHQVQNSLHGFGFMVPREEGLRTICTFWNSSLFPRRADDGRVLITSFVRNEPSGNSDATSEEALASTVEAENAAILGIAGEPVERLVWGQPRALPQYNVGHASRVAAIHDSLRTLAGLHLAGNYLKGRSIGDCVGLSFQVAEKVHSQLR